MMKSAKYVLLVIALVLSLPTAADAKRACLERTLMIDTLIGQYSEQLVEVREIKNTGRLEFHVSSQNGTWTALLTKNGTSCVLAVGEGVVSPLEIHEINHNI